MTTYGLTATGFVAKRAADVKDSLRAKWQEELATAGLPTDIDFDRDTVAGLWTAASAVELGEVWAAMQSVHDGYDPGSAVGVPLDNIGSLRVIPRIAATYSTVTLTLTGTSGTFIEAGSVVEGGGVDGTQRWATTTAITLTGGSDTVEARATEKGAIAAAIGEITTIVSATDGWTTVNNAVAATAGKDRETDPVYRQRQKDNPQVAGGRSIGALRATLLGLDGVTAAVILENRGTSSTTIAGKTLDAHSVLPVLAPNTLTSSQQDAVALALWNWGVAGIKIGGSASSDVLKSISGDGFISTNLGWDWATDLTVNIATTVVLLSGYVIGDVETDIQTAIATYIESLAVGATVSHLQVLAVIAGVEGVGNATVLLNGSATDVVPTAIQRPVVGTNTVTT